MANKNKPKNKKTENKEKEIIDIVEYLKTSIKENKELYASVIVIIGLFISVAEYVYMQGYYSFFGIDDKWIDAGNTSLYYKLVFPLCITILFIFPNLISALPFILKRERYVKIWYEILLFINSFGLLLILYSGIKINGLILLIAIVIEFILLLFSLDNDKKPRKIALSIWTIITVILIIRIGFKHNKLLEYSKFSDWKQLVGLLFVWFLMFGLSTFFVLSAKNKNNDTSNPSENENNKKIKNKNITFISSVIAILIMFSVLGILLYSDGQTNAKNKKSFDIIHLFQEEYYQNIYANNTNIISVKYDDELYKFRNDPENMQKVINEIKEKTINTPYIKIVEETNDSGEIINVLRRVVNAYIVMGSDDENYIIINGYIDQENNILYYFSDEQKIIEKQDNIINKSVFEDAKKG